MPLHDPFTSIFEEQIKPAAQKNGLKAVKADDISSNKPVMEDVWRYLNQARIVVADLSGSNPNVFYELGVAHTLGKEVIMIAQHLTVVPFDVGHIRFIEYEYPSGKEQLAYKLRETIQQVLLDSKFETPKDERGQKGTSAFATGRTQRVAALTTWVSGELQKPETFPRLVREIDPYESAIDWALGRKVIDMVAEESQRRWSLAPATARGYGENVFLSIENQLRARIEEVAKATEAERKKAGRTNDFGILLGQPVGERGKMATLMDTYRQLSGPANNPVEKASFFAALLKTTRFENEEDVLRILNKIIKEGIIFESRPGFFRQIS